MKKYMSPQMETLNFIVNENVSGTILSSMFNDGEFSSWDD